MDDQAFRSLVAAYEHDSRDDPQRFAKATARMAAFGFAAILLALAASAWGLIWGVQQLVQGSVQGWKLMLVLGCGSLLLSLMRALWMRPEAPRGIPITAMQAPRLFELIEKLRQRTGAPRPDRVLIDGELNAAVWQEPRLGLLGWHRNHLILGLPLLMGLSTRQLAAVIAHEFGHLRGAHGKLGQWVYRTRRSWFKLAEARDRAGLGGNVADLALAFFFRHFFPRFNARAFVLSRQQEFAADRTAHRIVGARPSAEGLQAIEVQARFLDEEFWPAVWQRAAATPSPAQESPYRELRRAVPASLLHSKAKTWLNDALKRLPDPDDTHPSLRDRLDFAEVKPGLPPPAASSAAEELLGESLRDWIGRLDARWRDEVARGWNEHHRHANGQRHMIDELARESATGPIPADDHLLWARAVRLLEGDAAYESVLRRLIQEQPDDLAGRYELGMLLVDEPDSTRCEEGAEWLRAVAQAGNHPWAYSAALRREAWLESRERFEELTSWRDLLRQRDAEATAAMEALHQFDGPRRFEPSGLSRRALRALQDLLRGERAAGRAWVIRKIEGAAASWRFCLVIVERARGLGQPDTLTWWTELREHIELPCPFMVIDLGHPYWRDKARSKLVEQMLAVPGAQVYAARR
ncbi:M48 family metallopeptidase [uncultured Piscinibacter sp.]|uniref:M48 family metallopeptidase n=1 Tax=uncultured Piscinibacter sp. TaxID=1131835 RepID=UPI0026203A36|nr:M48 family metallopeptidase [uncultured Piscinibacter sp.]